MRISRSLVIAMVLLNLVALLIPASIVIAVSGTELSAEFSATPLNGDEPLTVDFTDLSVPGSSVTSWFWSFGDGQTNPDQNPTHHYAKDGTYTVTLTVTDADGNSDTETKANYITVRNILAQQTVSSDSSTAVKSEGDQITIEFPEGSVAGEAVVTIREESQDSIPSAPSGFKAGAIFFSIELTEDLVEGTTVTISVKYSDADLEACGGNPEALTLSRYDESTDGWVILVTTVDTEAGTLTASTDQFSRWIVMVDESPAENQNQISLWTWLITIAGGLIVLIIISSIGRAIVAGR